MSKKLAFKISPTIQPSRRIRLKCANNNYITAIGQLNLTFNIGLRTFVHTFIVIENLAFPCFLALT